jgi:hypothetical protein
MIDFGPKSRVLLAYSYHCRNRKMQKRTLYRVIV